MMGYGYGVAVGGDPDLKRVKLGRRTQFEREEGEQRRAF